MALKLPGNDDGGQVDPENGVFVEMEGVMEMTMMGENDRILDKQDLFFIQETLGTYPEDLFRKDFSTGQQMTILCIVCDCWLTSLKTLTDHSKGGSHVKKAIKYKQRTLGIEPEPLNQPKRIQVAPPKVYIDINQSLKMRLEKYDGPILGLNYITEYTDPTDPTAPPLYTCALEGCKSTWGNSDDLFNHLKSEKMKHAGNYLRHVVYRNDPRVNSQNRNDLLKYAHEFCLTYDVLEAKDREYDTIIHCIDKEDYQKIASRPVDWSEKKEKLLTAGNQKGDTNHGGYDCNYEDRGLFNEANWKDFKPPTLNEVIDDLTKSVSDEVKVIRSMIEDGVDDNIILMQIDLNLDMVEYDIDVLDRDNPEYLHLINEDERVKKELLILKNYIANRQKSQQLQREEYIGIFNTKLKAHIQELVENLLKDKPRKDFEMIIKKIGEKILPKQIQNFEKKTEKWNKFIYGEKERTKVEKYTIIYIQHTKKVILKKEKLA